MFPLAVFERVLGHAYVANIRFSRIRHKSSVNNVVSETISLERANLTVSAVACPCLRISLQNVNVSPSNSRVMSLINRLNRRGLSWSPCFTPRFMKHLSEREFSTRTLALASEYIDFITCNTFP